MENRQECFSGSVPVLFTTRCRLFCREVCRQEEMETELEQGMGDEADPPPGLCRQTSHQSHPYVMQAGGR